MIDRRPLPLTLLLASLAASPAVAEDTPSIPSGSSTAKPQPEVQAMPTIGATEAPATEAPPPPAETAAAPAEEYVQESAPPRAGRAAKESASRLAPGYSGSTGLLRTLAAEGPQAGGVRLAFGLDFFSASSVFKEGDSASRLAGVLAISAVPVDHLELWLGTRAQSTNSSLTRPALIQALGDLFLGAKGFVQVTELVSLGASAQGTFLSGVGAQVFEAAQLDLRALATFDLSRTSAELPLRAHLNVGGVLDGSSALLDASLSDAEAFSQGISEFGRLGAALAVEVPISYVTPFLEYSIDIPIGYLATPGVILTGAAQQGLRAAQVGNESIASDPGHPGLGRVMPQRLTPGVRVTAIPDLTLDLAVEIGLTPDTAPGVVAAPPYNVVFLASYALDPFAKQAAGPPLAVPVIVPEPIAPVEPPPTTGLVTGLVEGIDGAPMEGAVVTFDRAPPVASADNGRFLSHELDSGLVHIAAKKEGFEPAEADVNVIVGKSQDVKLTLKPVIKEGVLRARISNTQGRAVASAMVDLTGPQPVSFSADANGQFERPLTAGDYLVLVNANGYYRAGKRVRVDKGSSQTLDYTLRPRAEPPLVELAGDAVRMKKKLAFTPEDLLAPGSSDVLDAVVDLLWARPDLKLRVEAHWDNSLPESEAMRRTTAQVNSILGYLSGQGHGLDRVDGAGMGMSKPVAPNLTQRGRDQNRRVEIMVR